MIPSNMLPFCLPSKYTHTKLWLRYQKPIDTESCSNNKLTNCPLHFNVLSTGSIRHWSRDFRY